MTDVKRVPQNYAIYNLSSLFIFFSMSLLIETAWKLIDPNALASYCGLVTCELSPRAGQTIIHGVRIYQKKKLNEVVLAPRPIHFHRVRYKPF